MRCRWRNDAWLLLVLAGMLLLRPPAAQAAFVTMVGNGPAANRVNIMFLGDGYTAAEIGTTYVSHINAMVDHLFNAGEDPFPRYQKFFNIYRIDVVSNESGADVPPLGVFRDTALDASYYFDGTTERLLSVDSNKAYAAMNAALAGSNLQPDIKLVTVNDDRYGGAGGSFAVYAGGHSAAPEIALHEIGHSFGGLADQYGGNPGTYNGPEPPEPDVTKLANGQKWWQWLGYDQPGIGVIGAYEGGRYFDHGIYRPSLNSKMRTLGMPFDAVGRERLVQALYSNVRPLDAWLGNSGVLTDPANLWVDVVDPDVIDVQWFVNGQLVPGAQSESFELRDFGFGAGTYAVRAHAFDPTDWVRIDADALEQDIIWNVVVSVIPGDLNDDGMVDIFDLAIVSAQWGSAGPAGDANGDKAVDIFDVNYISARWTGAAGGGGGGGAAVPEPQALSLAATCAVLLSAAALRRQTAHRSPSNRQYGGRGWSNL